MSKMPEGVREHLPPIADTIAEHTEQTSEGVLQVDSKAFEQTLPSGMTMDTVKQVYEHTNDTIAALTQVTGEQGQQILESNTQLDSVSAKMEIPGCGEVTVGYFRELEGPSEEGADDNAVLYGDTRIKLTTIGQGEPHQDLETIRETLRKEAEKVFSV